MSSLNLRIKKFLNDIIDVAYSDKSDNERKRYKAFKIYIISKEVNSYSGTYRTDTHTITINNMRLGTSHLVKCCLHELSHHIDWCQHEITGHQKPFYEVYEKLIFASLDMGLLKVEDFDDNWSRDQNKVRAIVSRYSPNPVDYNPEFSDLIRVYNSYTVKDILKTEGYKWNNIEQVWEKEIDDRIKDEELMNQLHINYGPKETDKKAPYYEISSQTIYVEPIVYIGATGNTFEKKEILKEYHFFFDGNMKIWKYKSKSCEYEEKIKEFSSDNRLNDCKFGVVSR